MIRIIRLVNMLCIVPHNCCESNDFPLTILERTQVECGFVGAIWGACKSMDSCVPLLASSSTLRVGKLDAPSVYFPPSPWIYFQFVGE